MAQHLGSYESKIGADSPLGVTHPSAPPTQTSGRMRACMQEVCIYRLISCLPSGHWLASRQSDLKTTTPGVIRV